MIAEIVFWCAVILVWYAYAGYPCLLFVVASVRGRHVRKGSVTPPVSFIIAAHNEEARIREKIEDTLAQDYPKELFEVMVASDCSTDGTDEVVRGYADQV